MVGLPLAGLNNKVVDVAVALPIHMVKRGAREQCQDIHCLLHQRGPFDGRIQLWRACLYRAE